jgi:thioredoxin-dependent peroxiredoxin
MHEKGRSVNFKGNPVTLVGPEIKVGQKSPDFILIDSSMKEIHSNKTKGKVKLLSVVLSIETPVCDTQTHSLNEEAGKYSNVAGYCISMDLPFCQEKYRKERQVKNLKMLSDHREASFGRLMAY